MCKFVILRDGQTLRTSNCKKNRIGAIFYHIKVKISKQVGIMTKEFHRCHCVYNMTWVKFIDQTKNEDQIGYLRFCMKCYFQTFSELGFTLTFVMRLYDLNYKDII